MLVEEVVVRWEEDQEEDQQVQDVLERADKMMYERKQELKAMGAKTREA